MLVDCEWGIWEDWLKCTASCGGGVQLRTRHKIAQSETLECSGSFIEHQICNVKPCPDFEKLQKDVTKLEMLQRDVASLGNKIVKKLDIDRLIKCFTHMYKYTYTSYSYFIS